MQTRGFGVWFNTPFTHTILPTARRQDKAFEGFVNYYITYNQSEKQVPALEYYPDVSIFIQKNREEAN